MTEYEALYPFIAKYEEAASDLQIHNLTASGAYCRLTDALHGFGSLDDACYRFEMEVALEADAHDHWKLAAANLRQEVADQLISKSETPRRCVQCGAVEVASNRWLHANGCNECHADGAERAELSAAVALHIDNVLYEETIQARDRADDDAASTSAFYGS